MGLQDVANSRLGNWHLRGISNGEKRRLSISVELLTQPHIMFMDEPTSGLDSAAAFYVILSLRSIAHDGRIVICSIHQPSSEVFRLFDDLVILAGGETVYFGETTMAIKFFAHAGFPCPTRKNPPEHFLRCVSPEFDRVAIFMLSKIVSEESFIGRKYEISKMKQLRTLTNRSFLNMNRDIGYYWLRILFFILVSVSAGFLYFNIGSSNEAILSRGKFDVFIYGFMIFVCVGGLPFYLEELKVIKRERFGRHYGEAIYVLSHFLSSLPFVFAITLSSGTTLYHMVKFHPGFSHYCYFTINLFLCISVAEGCMLFVAALVSNQLLAVGIAAGVTVRKFIDHPPYSLLS
ncbi:P-loop containing nucleoside triphosphate hydrolase [Sesbania bispinosa]|nr:P-loop containing nucleoside triphosphate hydrolase [Sesbania bispinosa]